MQREDAIPTRPCPGLYESVASRNDPGLRRGLASGGEYVPRSDQIAQDMNQRQERYRDQAQWDHLADEAHPTWWQRLRRRLKHEAPETET